MSLSFNERRAEARFALPPHAIGYGAYHTILVYIDTNVLVCTMYRYCRGKELVWGPVLRLQTMGQRQKRSRICSIEDTDVVKRGGKEQGLMRM